MQSDPDGHLHNTDGSCTTQDHSQQTRSSRTDGRLHNDSAILHNRSEAASRSCSYQSEARSTKEAINDQRVFMIQYGTSNSRKAGSTIQTQRQQERSCIILQIVKTQRADKKHESRQTRNPDHSESTDRQAILKGQIKQSAISLNSDRASVCGENRLYQCVRRHYALDFPVRCKYTKNLAEQSNLKQLFSRQKAKTRSSTAQMITS